MNFEGQYLTYGEYKLMGGELEIMPFNLLEFETRKIIDNYTFGRLINLKEQRQEVKMCVFALMNEIKTKQDKKNISSESVGSYSVSYGTNTTQEEIQNNYNLICNYLSDCYFEDGTNYLYRGV